MLSRRDNPVSYISIRCCMLSGQTYNYTIRPMFLLEHFRLFIIINFIIVMPIPRRVLQLEPGELVYLSINRIDENSDATNPTA